MPLRPLLLAFLLLAAAVSFTTPAHAQDYECDKPKGWKPTDDELETILARHKEWLLDNRFTQDLDDERRANLCNIDLRSTKLDLANLSYANLNGANLREAKLDLANLNYANLNGANLNGATLTFVDLSEATTYGADLSGITYNNGTIWPDDFDPAAHGAINEDD